MGLARSNGPARLRSLSGAAPPRPHLLVPDVREWATADDLAHFVPEAMERVPMGAFKVNERGTGLARHHPRMYWHF